MVPHTRPGVEHCRILESNWRTISGVEQRNQGRQGYGLRPLRFGRLELNDLASLLCGHRFHM